MSDKSHVEKLADKFDSDPYAAHPFAGLTFAHDLRAAIEADQKAGCLLRPGQLGEMQEELADARGALNFRSPWADAEEAKRFATEWRTRAERAEAEVERLRARIDDLHAVRDGLIRREDDLHVSSSSADEAPAELQVERLREAHEHTKQRLRLAERENERLRRHCPEVEIDQKLDDSKTCKVWYLGNLVFDGVSRDALIQNGQPSNSRTVSADQEEQRTEKEQ